MVCCRRLDPSAIALSQKQMQIGTRRCRSDYASAWMTCVRSTWSSPGVSGQLDRCRIGKGAGYGDIEVALLAEAGLSGPETTIYTTVHDLQS